MILTSDFECGNGKNIRQMGPRLWNVTEAGDKETYCYYFCFELRAENAHEAGPVTVEIIGDPDLKSSEKGDVGTQGLMGHCPCTIWVQRWEEWHPLPMTDVEFLKDRIVLRLEAPVDGRLRVTNVIPAPYTETVDFLKSCALRRPNDAEYFELGPTVEGRSLPGLRVTEGNGDRSRFPAGPEGAPQKRLLSPFPRPRIVVFSGQHAIEFPGTWGSRGIADWLTSRLADAAEVRAKYDVVVLPLVNPDGTSHGRNNFNNLGQDVYGAYDGVAAGRRPEPLEAAALWDFCQEPVPQVMLNIHCYCSLTAFVEYPMNGMYVLRDEALTDPVRLDRQRTIDEYVRFGSSGLTGHAKPNLMGVPGINHQMALAHGTFSTLFEINASTHGPTGAAREAIRCFRAMLAGYEACL